VKSRFVLALLLAFATLLGLAVTAMLATNGSAAPARPAAVLSAVVGINGNLVSGNGAVSARQLGADGWYLVTFDRDVSHCAFVGGAGDYPGDQYAGPATGVTIGIGPSDTGDVTSLSVGQYDTVLGRESFSSPFHLIVAC
jgi:hypothetical protein